ncbi:hypothetical protein [Pararhodonellum marinum]|uniref:hypothetical protein n=1 Tax=Pararhodonellum marinum TaxID=2755358 RepID=UPI001E56DB3E|nr:hypothetical protein [Pararhodonellum marinum]
MTRHIIGILGLFVFMTWSGCSPSTKIIGSWKSPEAAETGYQDLYVVALINENMVAKKTIEDDIDQLLREKGIQAESNLENIQPGLSRKKDNIDEVVQAIKESGSDGIMTVAVLVKSTETRYVPGSTNYYNPMLYGGYGRFGGYYGLYQPMVSSPGYYETDNNYFLEINLYDTSTEKLVWSAQSQTTNPSNIDTAAKAFSKKVVEQLIDDGIILPATQN